MGKLTEIGCKNAKCVDKKIVKIGDGDGLYLLVMASGSKYFSFRYKYNGKQKDLRIGVYPKITLSEARKLSRGHRALLDSGVDPSVARKNKAKANAAVNEDTFRFVGTEWYSKQSSWSKKHAEDVLRRLEVNLFPHLGDRPINEIDGPELLAVMRIMEERGATDLSHRVNGNAGQIFRYGIACGKCKYDVAAGIVDALRTHEKKNQPAVKPKEVQKLIEAIAKYEEIGDEQTQLGIKLLAHMFPRTKELILSKWDEYDIEESRMWEVPASRMKMKYDHIVPLSKQVIGYLKRLKELSGDSEYVLPGRNILTHMSNNTLLFALYRMGYKGKMTGHGFRAVASTILNESGLFNPDWIERQLAHQEENKVRGAYNRALYIKDRKIMMQWWSNYLEALEKGKKPVMHLPKPTR